MWQLSLSIWRSACSNSSRVGSILRLQQVRCRAASCCRRDACSNGANRLKLRAIYSACRKALAPQSAMLQVAVTAQNPPLISGAIGFTYIPLQLPLALSLIWKSSYLIALLFKLVEQTRSWVCSFHPLTISLSVFSICTTQPCVWLQRLEELTVRCSLIEELYNYWPLKCRHSW